MTTSNDPEAIRRQIEQTQRELSYDVDALNEKVNPSRVMDRRVSAAKGRVSRVRDRVMGSAQGTRATAQHHAQHAAGTVQDRAQGAAESVQGAAQQAAHAVQQAPDTIVRQAQGNPLAAGLIAFGVVRENGEDAVEPQRHGADRKSTRLNSSHANISYAVFCLKKKK